MNNIRPDALLFDPDDKPQESSVVQHDSTIAARIGIHWQGLDCNFHDWSYLSSIHLSRDLLPPQIESRLPGLVTGDEISHVFKAGELRKRQSSLIYNNIPANRFQPPISDQTALNPSIGRFYPSDYFRDIRDIYQGNCLSCRISDIQDGKLSIDCNHPLASKTVEMMVRIESIKKTGAEHGGRCKDIVALCCDHGPGMQDSLPGQDTDFWTGNPFNRPDAGNDSEFFSVPSLQPYWDRTALTQLSLLYRQLIPENAQILDLMAGVHSPLQEADIKPSAVICAGLNGEELEHNPLCTQAEIVDVNTIYALPFQTGQFDVVLIHAAIEYVINPPLLMTEVQRVLKPAGRIIISFSNRSVSEKAIQLWSGADEFERPAIVLAYLRNCAGFSGFNSYSMRGLLRANDDSLAHKRPYSDPVYAVWADKI